MNWGNSSTCLHLHGFSKQMTDFCPRSKVIFISNCLIFSLKKEISIQNYLPTVCCAFIPCGLCPVGGQFFAKNISSIFAFWWYTSFLISLPTVPILWPVWNYSVGARGRVDLSTEMLCLQFYIYVLFPVVWYCACGISAYGINALQQNPLHSIPSSERFVLTMCW